MLDLTEEELVEGLQPIRHFVIAHVAFEFLRSGLHGALREFSKRCCEFDC